jgi:hypothetical protein
MLWLLQFLPFVKKYQQYFIYAGIAVAIFMGLRYWGNTQYYKGDTSGRKAMASEIEKTKAKEWADQEAQIAKDRADVEILIQGNNAQLLALQQARSAASQQFKAQLDTIDARAKEATSNALQVPVSDLPDAIRAQVVRNRAIATAIPSITPGQ